MPASFRGPSRCHVSSDPERIKLIEQSVEVGHQRDWYTQLSSLPFPGNCGRSARVTWTRAESIQIQFQTGAMLGSSSCLFNGRTLDKVQDIERKWPEWKGYLEFIA